MEKTALFSMLTGTEGLLNAPLIDDVEITILPLSIMPGGSVVVLLDTKTGTVYVSLKHLKIKGLKVPPKNQEFERSIPCSVVHTLFEEEFSLISLKREDWAVNFLPVTKQFIDEVYYIGHIDNVTFYEVNFLSEYLKENLGQRTDSLLVEPAKDKDIVYVLAEILPTVAYGMAGRGLEPREYVDAAMHLIRFCAVRMWGRSDTLPTKADTDKVLTKAAFALGEPTDLDEVHYTDILDPDELKEMLPLHLENTIDNKLFIAVYSILYSLPMTIGELDACFRS